MGRLSMGVSGGYISSGTAFSGSGSQISVAMNNISTGIMLEHMSSKYAGLQISLQYSKKGIGVNDSTFIYKRVIDYIEIPLLTHFEIGGSKLKAIINLGPQFSFGYNVSESINTSDSLFANRKTSTLLLKNNKTERFQFGLAGGLGVNYQIGSVIIQLEGRYYNGFSNVIAPRFYSYFNNQTFGAYFSLLYNIPLKPKAVLPENEQTNP